MGDATTHYVLDDRQKAVYQEYTQKAVDPEQTCKHLKGRIDRLNKSRQAAGSRANIYDPRPGQKHSLSSDAIIQGVRLNSVVLQIKQALS